MQVTVWDTHDADGDIVRLVSEGFTREVVLTKVPTVVYMPYAGSGSIRPVGVHDGGGGITLGVRGADQSVAMPIMSVGQTISLPVQLP